MQIELSPALLGFMLWIIVVVAYFIFHAVIDLVGHSESAKTNSGLDSTQLVKLARQAACSVVVRVLFTLTLPFLTIPLLDALPDEVETMVFGDFADYWLLSTSVIALTGYYAIARILKNDISNAFRDLFRSAGS